MQRPPSRRRAEQPQHGEERVKFIPIDMVRELLMAPPGAVSIHALPGVPVVEPRGKARAVADFVCCLNCCGPGCCWENITCACRGSVHCCEFVGRSMLWPLAFLFLAATVWQYGFVWTGVCLLGVLLLVKGVGSWRAMWLLMLLLLSGVAYYYWTGRRVRIPHLPTFFPHAQTANQTTARH